VGQDSGREAAISLVWSLLEPGRSTSTSTLYSHCSLLWNESRFSFPRLCLRWILGATLDARDKLSEPVTIVLSDKSFFSMCTPVKVPPKNANRWFRLVHDCIPWCLRPLTKPLSFIHEYDHICFYLCKCHKYLFQRRARLCLIGYEYVVLRTSYKLGTCQRSDNAPLLGSTM
jgi:hypothetical protein